MTHTEPKLGWSRFAGLCALFSGFWYIHTADAIEPAALVFHGAVVAMWLLGGNGRAAIVDAIRIWAGK
jgi:hypothetical protein